MSGASFQILMGSAGGNAEATYIASSGFESTGATSTHTFSINCGGGGNVVACLTCHFSGSISTVTIGGVSATINVQRSAGGTNAPTGIASATGVPSGTQNIVVTTSGTCLSWACHTFTLANVIDLTPTATGSDSHTFGGCSGTLSYVDRGCTIGASECGNGGTPAAWTGLTKDTESASGIVVSAVAHKNSITADSALSWTASFGGSNNQTAAVWASWGPT